MSITPIREVREYSDRDREHAFEVYKDFDQGNRSLRKTARILDIPFGTLQYWNRVEQWQERVFAEDAREAELVRRSAEAKFVNELDRLVDQAFDLAYNGRPEQKTQADMTKYLLGVMRFSPVQKVEQDILDNRLKKQESQVEAKEKTMTREELIAQINALALNETTEPTEDAEFREVEKSEETGGL